MIDTFDEPILVIAFNRPDHLRTLISRLREIKPGRLFVAIDGPRAGVLGDSDRVQQCRDLVTTVDWRCEIRTLFQESNLGCGHGVSTAISWFFEYVEAGIILEDDIIPTTAFFPYCSDLLERYRDDTRVFAVSGCNFVPPQAQTYPDFPYRFSQVPHIWGWATWRRSWDKHQLNIAGWQRKLPPTVLWRRSGRSLSGAVYWASTFELLARKKVDTWDGQLVLASMIADQWTATSNVNLIENIGFGEYATHTVENREELQPVGHISFPMKEVPVRLDTKADAWTRQHHFRANWRGILRQAQTYLSSSGM